MRLVGRCVALGILLTASVRAQQKDDTAGAQELFDRARVLMSEGKYAEACPLLEESERLDPGGGTELNLAACHEHIGRLASAWAEYKLALGAARRDGRSDRVKAAEEHIAALEPRLSYLKVSVSNAADVSGLSIERDGIALGRPAWGTRIPVDTGKHRISVRAPQRKAAELELDVSAEGQEFEVAIPELELEPEPEAPAPSTPHVLPPPRPVRDASPSTTASATEENGSWRRPAGYAGIGLGVLSIGVGTYFGIRALNKGSEANDICASDVCPASQRRAVDLNDEAHRSATIANVSIAAGLALGAVGSVLLLTAPDGTRAHVGIGPHRATLALSGTF